MTKYKVFLQYYILPQLSKKVLMIFTVKIWDRAQTKKTMSNKGTAKGHTSTSLSTRNV